MSVSRGIPESLVQLVSELQTQLNFQPAEDRLVLPRAVLIAPGEAAPDEFWSAYQALIAGQPSVPYTVYLPACQAYHAELPARLVCCLGDNLTVFEAAGREVRRTCFPLADLHYIETGRVLLYSWLRIYGRTAEGAAAAAGLEFNTVTDYVVKPLIDWARSIEPGQRPASAPTERSDFDYLRGPNLKLANYARRSVAPGGPLVQQLYQPPIRVPLIGLFGLPLVHRRANAHILILTGRELIDIQDGAFKRFGRNAMYGGVWEYILRERIISAALAETANDLLALTVHLTGDHHLEFLFEPPVRPQLDELLARLNPSA